MRKKRVENIIYQTEFSPGVNKMIKLSSSEKRKYTKQMEQYANNFLKDNFGLQLEIPIEICGRLSRAGGSFHSTYDDEAIKIKMSERFIACARLDKKDGVKAILDILEHELVHYALCVLGKDYNDGSEDFENALAQLHISSSGSTNEKKIKTRKQNVWYSPLDVYKTFSGKKHTRRHTKSETDWAGQRVEFRIVKTIF